MKLLLKKFTEVSIEFFENSFKNDIVLKKFSQKFAKSSHLGTLKLSLCRVYEGIMKGRKIGDEGVMEGSIF
ncbi:hypothetical protein DUI32_12805 [Enterococcus faecalis]|nr:hypothetical protein [Enterococcus faecalis]EGO8956837.1 hypothetical protein [Enterococcus faecalis]EGO9236910.1 hypothetical protein [Enterococcus faecalis]